MVRAVLDEGGGDVLHGDVLGPDRQPSSEFERADRDRHGRFDFAWLNRMAAGIKVGGNWVRDDCIARRTRARASGCELDRPGAAPADLADAQAKEGHVVRRLLRGGRGSSRLTLAAARTAWGLRGERRRLVGRRALSRGRALRGCSRASRGPGGSSPPGWPRSRPSSSCCRAG